MTDKAARRITTRKLIKRSSYWLLQWIPRPHLLVLYMDQKSRGLATIIDQTHVVSQDGEDRGYCQISIVWRTPRAVARLEEFAGF